jgi:type I restriction enzyme, S subunit
MDRKKKETSLTLEEKLREALVPKSEQPYPIPENWVWTKIHSVVSINPAKKRIDDVDPDAAVTFVPMAAVDHISGEITAALQRPLMEVKTGYTQFIEGDVIFAKITPCMENGKTAIVKETISGIAYGSTEFYVLRPLGIDASLLYFFVRAQSFRNEAKQVMSGAVGQQRVPKAWLEQHQIPLPPLPEQQRIAEKLESLLGKIKEAKALLDEIPEILQNFRQSVLAAACSGKLTEGWPAHSDFLSKYLREIATWSSGGTPSRAHPEYYGGNIPWIKTGELRENIIIDTEEKITQLGLEKSSAKIFPIGTVLVAMYGATIGRVALLGIEAATNQACAAAIPIDDQVTSRYLFYLLQAEKAALVRKGQGGAQPNISQGLIKEHQILLPTLQEQQEIVYRIESLFSKADDLEIHYKEAMELIESLPEIILSKAFRGKLLPQDTNDEPAIKLLERILKERESIEQKEQTKDKLEAKSAISKGKKQKNLKETSLLDFIIKSFGSQPFTIGEIQLKSGMDKDYLRNQLFELISEAKRTLKFKLIMKYSKVIGEYIFELKDNTK